MYFVYRKCSKDKKAIQAAQQDWFEMKKKPVNADRSRVLRDRDVGNIESDEFGDNW